MKCESIERISAPTAIAAKQGLTRAFSRREQPSSKTPMLSLRAADARR
jgi:hypothetical protein